MIRRITLISIFCSSLYNFSSAQEALKPRPSPLAIASVRYKDTYLKITYGQPQKRGRIIFGKLVPFGEVWRTGANESTEITLTRDVLVDNKPLKAGTYSLFTIPDPDHWTIIFNADLGQWGAYTYNQKLDVLRLEAKPREIDTAVYEPFTITIESHNDKAEVILMWDKTKVSFPVQFSEPKTP